MKFPALTIRIPEVFDRRRPKTKCQVQVARHRKKILMRSFASFSTKNQLSIVALTSQQFWKSWFFMSIVRCGIRSTKNELYSPVIRAKCYVIRAAFFQSETCWSFDLGGWARRFHCPWYSTTILVTSSGCVELFCFMDYLNNSIVPQYIWGDPSKFVETYWNINIVNTV